MTFLSRNRLCCPGIPSDHPALGRIILITTLAFPATFFGTPPSEKAPEKWDHTDAYRVLQDSPWSPAQVKLDTKSTYRYADRQTGRVDDSSFNRDLSHPVRGIDLSRARQLRPIPVLWWSSRMVRLAQQRFVQSHHPTISTQRLEVPNLPDCVEGDEPLRIFRGCRRFARYGLPRTSGWSHLRFAGSFHFSSNGREGKATQ